MAVHPSLLRFLQLIHEPFLLDFRETKQSLYFGVTNLSTYFFWFPDAETTLPLDQFILPCPLHLMVVDFIISSFSSSSEDTAVKSTHSHDLH